MKVDAYMPFYGKDFIGAARPYGPLIGWHYLLALWAYWSEHCAGIPDDDLAQRRVCEFIGSDADWLRVKAVIFGHWFVLYDDGRWHQGRARKEYEKSVAISAVRSEIGKRGISKRYGKDYSKTSSKQPN